MLEYDSLEDLSTLTTIPKDTIVNLFKKLNLCICDELQDSSLKNEEINKINIGIGYLFISNADDQIRYKFIPNEDLENSIKETLIEGKNPLQRILEKNLVAKILNTYKDII